eukprot:3362664-Ditylum_brightwellii.AAC.1
MSVGGAGMGGLGSGAGTQLDSVYAQLKQADLHPHIAHSSMKAIDRTYSHNLLCHHCQNGSLVPHIIGAILYTVFTHRFFDPGGLAAYFSYTNNIFFTRHFFDLGGLAAHFS